MTHQESTSLYWRLKYLVDFKFRLFKVRRLFGLAREKRSVYSRVNTDVRFHVVSCERNAGEAAVRCLQSVYDQDYPKEKIRHLFVDDDSTDNTRELIEEWMGRHPDHSVLYVKTMERRGGPANTMSGFRMANPGEIVAELNGDDWLPDPGVLSYLNRVYEDSEVWTTYNSVRFTSGRFRNNCQPVPEDIIHRNAFRTLKGWPISCMHTFRAELFSHLPEHMMIDPQTGEYWANADDVAMYMSLCELAGFHCRHIYRYTYVQNVREYSEVNVDGKGQKERGARIVAMTPLEPLTSLSVGDEQVIGAGVEAFDAGLDSDG